MGNLTWLVRNTFQVLALPQELESILAIPRSETRTYLSQLRGKFTWARTQDAWLYCLVRGVRPERVVETGVYYGSSSSAILQALHDNGAGHLTSIDLPTRKGYVNADGVVDRSFVENAADTGREVPPYLRDRWSLRLGNSTELLPIVLRESAPISLFFHDSDHSYSHQKWEYESAWPSIRPGGILASDDVDWTPAFREFAKRVHAVSHIFHFGSGVRGLLIKPGTETLREMKSSNEG